MVTKSKTEGKKVKNLATSYQPMNLNPHQFGRPSDPNPNPKRKIVETFRKFGIDSSGGTPKEAGEGSGRTLPPDASGPAAHQDTDVEKIGRRKKKGDERI
jgi:hypothetical protein